MEKEKMASKLEDFLLDFDYLEGFTTYRAYCYVFDLDYDLNIHYDERNRVNSKDMSFEDFREWLDDYLCDYHDEYELITIFGCYDDVYCNFKDFS